MFIFYSNFDQTKEPVGKIKADSYEEAVENAAQIKQLSIDDFLKLFTVEELN
jgi:hypothetical protein